VEELQLLVEKKRSRREHQGDVVDAAPAVVLAAGEAECEVNRTQRMP